MSELKKQNKFYFLILSIVTCLVLLISIKKNIIFDKKIIFYSIFFISVILIFIFYFLLIKKINFYPINLLFNLYFLTSYLFFIYNLDYIFNFIYPELFKKLYLSDYKFLILEVSKFLIFVIIFFNIGFLITNKFFNKKVTNFFPELDQLDLIRIIFFSLLFKLSLLLFNYFLFINLEELLDPLNLLIASICVYLINYDKKNNSIFYLIFIFIFIENALLTFSIYKNVILLIMSFLVIYYQKKKISLVIILLLACWVIIGQSYKVPLRNNFLVSQENEISNQLSKTDVFIKYDSNPVILRLTEPIISLVRILEFDKILKKKVKMDTLSILLYSPIPRILYPEKPKQDYAYRYTDYFFNIYDFEDFDFTKTVTYNIYWPSDLYLNFGYKGAILAAFLLGVCISFLLLIFTNFKTNNFHLLFGFCLFSKLSIPDYNLSLMFSPIILQFFILFIFFKFCILLLKKFK